MQLKYKPNFSETQTYFDAFWQKEVIDRPVVCVTAPKKGAEPAGHKINYANLLRAGDGAGGIARADVRKVRVACDFNRAGFAENIRYRGRAADISPQEIFHARPSFPKARLRP